MLQYGSLLAEKHAAAALKYVQRASELVALIGNVPDALSRFENWFKAGMEVLAYSPDGALAYFSVESQEALSSVEAALSGVPFRQVARLMTLFVQGLCGADVTVAALPDSVTTPARATVSENGQVISLPALLRRYPTAEENERLFHSTDPNEPPHVHVDRDDLSAKFWLEPVGLARNLGFTPKELRRIQKLVVEHQAVFLEAWHGHFGTDG